MKRFDKKTPDETVTLTFNFDGELPPGSTPTIVSVEITHDSGDADPSPAGMLRGDAVLDGARVMQRIGGGVEGANYLLRCTLDIGQGDHLVRAGLLPIRRA